MFPDSTLSNLQVPSMLSSGFLLTLLFLILNDSAQVSNLCFYSVSFTWVSFSKPKLQVCIRQGWFFFMHHLIQSFGPICVFKWPWFIKLNYFYYGTMFLWNGAFSFHYPLVSATGWYLKYNGMNLEASSPLTGDFCPSTQCTYNGQRPRCIYNLSSFFNKPNTSWFYYCIKI